jgi:hypothetical protein
VLLARRTMHRPRSQDGPALRDGQEPLLLANRGFRDRADEEPWFERTLAGIQHRDLATVDAPALAVSRFEVPEMPLVSLPVLLQREDFDDADDGRPRFSVNGLVADQQRSILGGRAQVTLSAGETVRVLGESRAKWLCEFLQSPAADPVFFAPGDQAIYAVQGLHYGNNWLLVGKAVRWELSERLTAFAAFDAQINGQEMFHIGSSGLAFGW